MWSPVEMLVRRSFEAPARRLRAVVAGICMTMALCGAVAAMDATPVQQWEGPLDVAMVGGTVLKDTCAWSSTSASCVAYGSSDWPDLQGDTVSDWPNFRVMYGIPADAAVVQAFLTWMASRDPSGSPDLSVRFQAPDGAETDVAAKSSECRDLTTTDGQTYYACRADITGLLRAHVQQGRALNGFWNFGQLAASTDATFLNGSTVLGAWSVIIVYQTPSSALRHLYLYEGFDRLQCQSVTFTPSGFEVDADSAARVTFLAGEGDSTIAGAGTCASLISEGILFNGVALSDSCNPSDNPFNSTRNTNVDPSVGACETNVYSLDLDSYDVTGLMKAGDASATVTVNAGQDVIFLHLLLVSMETSGSVFDIPDVAEKRADPAAGRDVRPGDRITYTIDIQNNSAAAVSQVYIVDALPAYTRYVCGSTTLSGPDRITKTIPDSGACGLPLAGRGYSVVDTLAPGDAARWRAGFTVEVLGEENGVADGAVIANTARIGSDATGEEYLSNGGIPVRHTVRLSTAPAEALRVLPGPSAPTGGILQAGAIDLPLWQATLKAEGAAAAITRIELQAEGTLDPAASIGRVSLYWDANADGSLSDGDGFIGRKSFSGDSGAVSFNLTGVTIPQDGSRVLLALGDFAAALDDGKQFRLILPGGGVTSTPATATADLPLTGPWFSTPMTGVLITEGPRSPGAFNVTAGGTVVVWQLALVAGEADYSLNSMQFSIASSMTGSHVKDLRLYLDSDGDGATEDEPVLGHDAPRRSLVRIEDIAITLRQGLTVLLLVEVLLSPEATEGETLRLSLDTGSLGVKKGSAAGGVSGLPLSSGSFPVMGMAVDGDLDAVDSGDDGEQYQVPVVRGGCSVGAAELSLLAMLVLAGGRAARRMTASRTRRKEA